jgi:hypothetical protein
MVSDHQAAANQPTVDDEQSHLLKLPPEIRNRIYELVLTVNYSFMITEIYKPLRPGLLQDSRQLRAETRLMYHELMEHDIVVTINNTAEIRRWAETLADDELRSIQSLNFHFVKKYGRLTYAKRTRYETRLVFVFVRCADTDLRAGDSRPWASSVK